MEKVAFISGDIFIYWSPILLALAAAAGICIYCAVYVGRGRSLTAAVFSAVLCVIIGIPLSRLIHWYCRTGSYPSLSAAMSDYSKGGYALAGMFFGCMLAACLIRLLQFTDNLPLMLDSMAVGGSAAICVGRLASLFNTSDRGMVLPESVEFPLASTVVNAVSGASEHRLATFMIQSMLAGALAVLLLLYMIFNGLRKRKSPDGDASLLFLLIYGSCQAICDSTRVDSLFLRSNGFVSIVQILGLMGLLIPVVLFSVRMLKRWRLKLWQFPLWLAIAGLLGTAGYMEYYVQRHYNKAVLAYSVMGGSLAAVILLGLLIRHLSLLPKKENN